MEDLEKYIKENKPLFDEHKADRAKIWATIDERLDTPKSTTFWQSPFLKIAASILIILSGFSTYHLFVSSKFNGTEKHQIVNNELSDIDTYYKGLVSFQVKLIQEHPKLQEKDKVAFLSFMDDLDQEYEILKLEMTKNLNNEYILEAIINNYKKRIELIENLLSQINNSKKINSDEDYIL
ncbi:hypothetical protein D1816_25045 [Aquimarina sp. AD10]|uniref:Anti-sigma factor n=1 Tax=Aquimarina aggregata TaxID=1642818 RepID=A0A163BVS9_9FLAO|nr:MULTISPECIES: hypothetical protein [Aquimarina]AXT63468.1 hypothetical protein D1816_25045 [Aquimarina sp. AD10]KZS41842.1 hypothetical protein AWE51_20830 [Aquimarina aggregata]RKM91611.1 hypothetical protein D7033_22030 [Aquimarina sp. AD10]